MKSPEEALEWFRAEIASEAAEMVEADKDDNLSVRQFANGCIDGYVRTGWHLEVASRDELRKIAEDAIEAAKQGSS